ncbi:Cytochrome c4 [Ensifer adhaerens]|uniref:c-type cytochrome n=1 Tax=Ensifer adhaerens TaxID=106592 RepID=UPI001567C7ED|nr:c-type cytochrome [Ensifer adhaerens]NRP21882.1 Cytochrome c4 [Ensifer adhaerens]
MKRCLTCIAGAVVIAGVGGLSIAGLGLVDVGAASGHYAMTEWVLHSVMRASVRTAAIGIEAPKTRAPESGMTIAAVHFERACSTCHGSPRRKQSPDVLAMLPPPPDLSQSIGSWSAEELFVIVRDGIRYTGMPAWPATHRDDEVWTMVAFLRKLPGLDPAGYSNLLNARHIQKGRSCAQCHDGKNALAPNFQNQSEIYLRNSLTGYLEGKRSSGIMQVVVAGMDLQEIANITGEYSKTARNCRHIGTASAPTLVVEGDEVRKIPACNGCHDGKRPDYPVLDGLPAAYIATQLALFRGGNRVESVNQERMAFAARNLTDEDMWLVSKHFSSQAPLNSACEE